MKTSNRPIVPEGAKVLRHLHARLSAILGFAERAAQPIERTGLRQGLDSQFKTLRESLGVFHGLFARTYPDQPALPSAEGIVCGTTLGAAKSWLANHHHGGLETLGARLGTFAKASNLNPEQRRILGAAKSLLEEATTYDERIARLERSQREIIAVLDKLISKKKQKVRNSC